MIAAPGMQPATRAVWVNFLAAWALDLALVSEGAWYMLRLGRGSHAGVQAGTPHALPRVYQLPPPRVLASVQCCQYAARRWACSRRRCAAPAPSTTSSQTSLWWWRSTTLASLPATAAGECWGVEDRRAAGQGMDLFDGVPAEAVCLSGLAQPVVIPQEHSATHLHLQGVVCGAVRAGAAGPQPALALQRRGGLGAGGGIQPRCHGVSTLLLPRWMPGRGVQAKHLLPHMVSRPASNACGCRQCAAYCALCLVLQAALPF